MYHYVKRYSSKTYAVMRVQCTNNVRRIVALYGSESAAEMVAQSLNEEFENDRL